MLNKQGLKFRIEDEMKILQFFVRYEEEIMQMTSETEWENGVNDCLDRLIDLFKLLKD